MVGEEPTTNTSLLPTKRLESKGRAGTSTEQQRMFVGSSLCLLSSVTNLAIVKRGCDHGMNSPPGPTGHFSLESFFKQDVLYFCANI